MKVKNISITTGEKPSFIYKKYEVEYAGKKDIIYYSQDDWGIHFEPYNGNFSEKQLEEIQKFLWDDAYYNKNFSIFI